MVTRLELPHLERYAVDSVHRVRFSGGWAAKAIPTPVESANHPFASCAADNIERGPSTIEYDIACPGRGGKNMTMAEVVRGHRLGACNETVELAPTRF